jgi:CubicO group peptidase (beta-lactamase class C family)
MRVHKVPAVAVALLRDFQVVAVRHLGVTEAGGKQTIDPSTLFPAGAMGGPVAATVALRLAAEGRLDLDRDVNSYLKTWKVPGGRTVTVRDLLTHRSGFRIGKYEGYAPNAPVPTLDQVLRGQAPARSPAAVPTGGDAFALAGENYTVLQKVIEDVTGRPWAEVAQTSIAAPFGGQIRSRYAVLRPEAVGLRAALGHDDGGVILPDGGRAYPELAASGLWTNADEYADFLADVLRSASGKEGLLLPADSARLLLTPVGENATVAFGSTEKGGTRYLFRGGNTAGYYCHLDADPGRGNAVVIFTNRNLCWQFTNEVRDALAKAEGWQGY